jgi:hypothetical protein
LGIQAAIEGIQNLIGDIKQDKEVSNDSNLSKICPLIETSCLGSERLHASTCRETQRARCFEELCCLPH